MRLEYAMSCRISCWRSRRGLSYWASDGLRKLRCGEMSLIIVNGIVLQMISLISSNGIGTVAMLLAILVVGIRCVSTGVYWRKREIALGRVIS